MDARPVVAVKRLPVVVADARAVPAALLARAAVLPAKVALTVGEIGLSVDIEGAVELE